MKHVFLAGICIFLSLTFCGKNGSGPSNQIVANSVGSITMPRTASMTIPVFATAGSPKKTAAPSTSPNHDWAEGLLISWVGSIYSVATLLGVPIGIFDVAQSAAAEEIADTLGWTWNVAKNGFTGVLTAIVGADSLVNWTMHVTGGTVTDYLWFYGKSSMNGLSGNWSFNDTLGNVAFVKFIYSLSESSNDGTIRCENIKNFDPNKGSHITCSTAGDVLSFVTFTPGSQDTSTITLNTLDGSGSLQIGSAGQKHCWDTDANANVNTTCP